MQKEAGIILLIVLLVATTAGIFLAKEKYGQAILSRQTSIRAQPTSLLSSSKLTTRPISSISPKQLCVTPTSNMTITKSTKFCKGTYSVDNIQIQGNNIILDCDSARLVGTSSPPPAGGQYDGIVLSNTNNAVVKNCELGSYSRGIVVLYSTNYKLNNNIVKRSGFGIVTAAALNGEIFENTIMNNVNNGIALFITNNTQIHNNIVNDHTISWMTPGTGEQPPYSVCPGSAITVQQQSINNQIYNNTIDRACMYGIAIFDSNNNNAQINKISNISDTGIYVANGANHQVYRNTVTDSTNTVRLWLATMSTVERNNLHSLVFPSKYFNDPIDEAGSSNTWSTNFYSAQGSSPPAQTSTCPDINQDTICDQPRPIAGTTGSVDLTPSKIWLS